jgi:Protein of unknown function (DUF2510)
VSTPPGWYPDAAGTQRYWDGQAWTAHTAPPGPGSGIGAEGRTGAAGPSTAKVLVWVVVATLAVPAAFVAFVYFAGGIFRATR